MSDIAQRLAAPFAPETVSWRVGSTNKDKTKAMALAYIDARDVMNRLDEVCGAFGWQSEHIVTGDMVTCHIRIRNPDTGEWITKSDGAGKTDVEGEKGSYSDALKRSAVSWGIGRYLYDLDSPWVAIEPVGRSYKIADAEKPKLLAVLRRQGGVAPGRQERPEAASNAPAPQPQQPAPPRQEPRLPSPEEPPAVTIERYRLIRDFWSRESYALHPEVVDGGLTRWDHWLLAYANAAPNIDALLKLKDDNRQHFKQWFRSVREPVSASLTNKLAAIERRLNPPVSEAAQ